MLALRHRRAPPVATGFGGTMEQHPCHDRLGPSHRDSAGNLVHRRGTSDELLHFATAHLSAHVSHPAEPQEFRGPMGEKSEMLRSATAYGESTPVRGRGGTGRRSPRTHGLPAQSASDNCARLRVESHFSETAKIGKPTDENRARGSWRGSMRRKAIRWMRRVSSTTMRSGSPERRS